MSLDEVEILVIGLNVWGRAKDLDTALQNASRPKQYQVFVCHKETRMDDMGHVSYPKDCVPREICRKGVRPGKEIARFTPQNTGKQT